MTENFSLATTTDLQSPASRQATGNDLLSYILVPAKQTATYDVTDIVVSNANTYFGLLERPDTAHQGYLKNPAVIKLIACGNKAENGCKPQ